jgi:uncharacterized protein (DUF342 family)
MAELYKISLVEGKIMLRVPPQLVGAQTADMDEIQAELHLMDADYLPEKLLEIYQRSSGAFEFLCEQVTRDFIIQVDMTNDEQEAYVNIIPPQSPQEPLTVDRILAALKEKGIVQGVDKERVQQMIDNEIYYDPTKVAHGTPPVNGDDARAEFLFLSEENQAKLSPRPDLREIPMLQEVTAGQPLVRLHSPTEGKDGYTITGRLTAAYSGNAYHIRPGRNTSYDAEREHIIAIKDGVVCQSGNSISVEEVQVVDKVDAKSGHIRFDGILKVRGNVADRYSVEAVRIDVGGMVGKAKLRAAGDIRLAQTATGSIIQAGGSVIADSLEECQISAGEHVLVRSHITSCKILAGISLQVRDKEAMVIGGALQAGNLMRLNHIGEEPPPPPEEEAEPAEGAPALAVPDDGPEKPKTVIEVGISINSRKAYKALGESLKNNFYDFQDKLKALEEKLDGFPDRFETPAEGSDELVAASRKACRLIFNDMRKISAQEEINQHNDELSGGILFVTGRVEPGTIINIRRMRFNVMSPAQNMCYQFVQTGIQANPGKDHLLKHRHRFVNLPA